MTNSIRIIAATVAVLTVLGCSSRTESQPAASTPAPSTQEPAPASAATLSDSGATDWLVVDSATRTVTLSLETTPSGSEPSALINGLRAGGARILVPLGWTIKWNWRNADPTASHSLVVMAQREKIPLEGGRPAFTNAMTRMVTAGLAEGETDQTTFVAEEAGWYWLLCGVPNHALNGEWIELRVDPEATTASVKLKS